MLNLGRVQAQTREGGQPHRQSDAVPEMEEMWLSYYIFDWPMGGFSQKWHSSTVVNRAVLAPSWYMVTVDGWNR